MTKKQLLDRFFDVHPMFTHERRTRKQHNSYSCNCRSSFTVFVDWMNRDGEITDAMAKRVTLTTW